MIRQLIFGGAVAAAAASLAAGCAGGSAYGGSNGGGGGGGMQSNCTVPISPSGTEEIGIDLSTASCNDSTYQAILGFFGGTSVVTSQVMSVMHSATNVIQFNNLDNQPHTGADLGAWSGTYPANGPNPSATPSPTGTDISAAGFTTGNLNPSATSKMYVANVPGVYVFGCAYHYGIGMRTVIIVQ